MMKTIETEAPRELVDAELDHVWGGAGKNWVDENPGGQPNGASAVTYNGGGNAPLGQNKDLPPGQLAKL